MEILRFMEILRDKKIFQHIAIVNTLKGEKFECKGCGEQFEKARKAKEHCEECKKINLEKIEKK